METKVYKIKFCPVCHFVRKGGKWVKIDAQISKALTYPIDGIRYGEIRGRDDWEPVFVICPNCNKYKLVEVAVEKAKTRKH